MVRFQTLILAWLAISPCTALSEGDFLYLSDPGMCDAPDGVTELLDTTFLTSSYIGNHFFECTWTEDLEKIIAEDHWPEVSASCVNGTESWTQTLQFYPQDNSNLDYDLPYPIYLSVWFDAHDMMPAKFYKCSENSDVPDVSAEGADRTFKTLKE